MLGFPHYFGGFHLYQFPFLYTITFVVPDQVLRALCKAIIIRRSCRRYISTYRIFLCVLPVFWDTAFLAQNVSLPILPQGSSIAGEEKCSLRRWWDFVIHEDHCVLLVPTTAILMLWVAEALGNLRPLASSVTDRFISAWNFKNGCGARCKGKKTQMHIKLSSLSYSVLSKLVVPTGKCYWN